MFLIFFILGLIVGSFLNVVVYRLRTAEDLVWERSHCPHCKSQIDWYDNIPLLSFILLNFKCRHCQTKISWQYPLVEFFTALLFGYIGMHFFDPGSYITWIITLYYLGTVSFLMVILVYDWLYMEILLPVLYFAIAWVVGFGIFFDAYTSDFTTIFDSRVFSGALAAFLAFLFFWLLAVGSKEKWMGLGDAYLAILLGLILGWPQIVMALILSFAIGAIVGSCLILVKRKKMDSQIPFAPFLVVGTLIVMFFYEPILQWYTSLIL